MVEASGTFVDHNGRMADETVQDTAGSALRSWVASLAWRPPKRRDPAQTVAYVLIRDG